MSQVNVDQGRRNIGLDLVRVFAITLVLIAHFAKVFESLGFWGVEFFFALSGYLIGAILFRGFSSKDGLTKEKIYNFWQRRWWRTVPNYVLFLIVSLFFHYFWGGLPDLQTGLKYPVFFQTFFSNNISFYGVSWSLCIEEWFYLLFALFMYFVSFKKSSKRSAYLKGILLFILFAFVAKLLVREVLPELRLRGATSARLDAIAFGVLASHLRNEIFPGLKAAVIMSFAGVLLLVPAFWVVYFSGISYDHVKSLVSLTVVVPLGFSLILPICSTVRRLPSSFGYFESSITSLSCWSYSIYLSHLPILFTVYWIAGDLQSDLVGNLMCKALGLSLTIGISAMIYKFFELPFTAKRPREIL